jgi:acyl-CoA dehydrogenase
MWSFETEPDFQKDLDWMRGFLDEEILPLEVLDAESQQYLDAVPRLQLMVKARGLWAAHLDAELGGRGFGQLKLGLMQEIIGRSAVAPFIFGTQAPDAGNSEILARHATKEQRARWLDPLLDGRYKSAYAMTELNTAGADPTLLRTSAAPTENGWRINGEKWFITNASLADFFIVMAVTDPDEAPHRRASQFIVPKGTPGLTVVRELSTMDHVDPAPGTWDSHAEVTLENVEVAEDALLGARGAGFLISQERLGPGRIHHCMRWIGQASRALDMLCERSLYRESHGSVLADKQTIQNWIADSWAELNAARLMTLQAAWKIDTHGVKAARTEISAIKYFGAAVLHNVVDRALQAHGALGYSADLPLEDMYRRARAARIYDGPDEVHRQVVASQVLKNYTAPADMVPTEHVPTRRARVLDRSVL